MSTMQHNWIPSTLGHGETMCARCFITNREAAVLELTNKCDAPLPTPAPANDDKAEKWTQNEIDEDVFRDAEDDGPEPGEECGRWRNGRLAQYCAKAGTEECDFECPYRNSACVRC